VSQALSISIALCTYNGERYLPEQLDSFLRQTRRPDELVVSDDGSQDGTVSLVETFAARAPFPVRLFLNHQNVGHNRNFEKAISQGRGSVIAPSDQDDVWLPEKLAEIEQVFQERPGLGYLIHDATVVDEKLQPLGYSLWEAIRFKPRLQKIFANGGAREILFKSQYVWGCTLALRGDLPAKIFPIPPLWDHDRWIGLVVSLLAEVTLIAQPLILYRQHGDQRYGVDKGRSLRNLTRNLTKGQYAQRAAMWTAALDHLATAEVLNINQKFLRAMEDKIEHLHCRSQMARSRLRRFPYVLREIILGRYHRYSSGWVSAAKDLLAP
jgi:glycosyltransferase involved in cell wall biosynthesis